MADTIVNTPASNDGGASGWVVALIILIVVIIAGFAWYRYGSPRAAAPGTTNINVTVPAPTTGAGGNLTP